MTLYGSGAVMPQDTIDLIVHLETWTPDTHFDRLGDRGDTQMILMLKCQRFPYQLKQGGTLAIIIESAAMNYRAETMGYDATKTFDENLNRLIKQNSQANQTGGSHD